MNETTKGTQTKLPYLILWISALCMLICFLLPYASATKDRKEHLKEYSDYYFAEEIGMTNQDAINISLLEYCKMYTYAAKVEMTQTLAIICLVVMGITALFAVLTLLFAFLKKPIATFIFNLINLGAFSLMGWDYKDRGVIGNDNYAFGLGYYLYYVLIVVVFAMAVWLFVAKRQEKKEKSAE